MVATVPPPTSDAPSTVLTDRGRVPSDLSVRFVVLMLLILSSTAAIYGYLALVSVSAEARAVTCIPESELQRLIRADATLPDLSDNSLVQVLRCTRSYLPRMFASGGIGILLVAALGASIYRLLPWWEIRYPNRRKKSGIPSSPSPPACALFDGYAVATTTWPPPTHCTAPPSAPGREPP